MAFPISTIKIVETDKEIANRILIALAKEINKKVKNIVGPNIKRALGILIKDKIRAHPIWQSLDTGSLRGDLGIPLNTDLEFILNVWANNIQVNVSKFYSKIKATNMQVSVVAIRSTYSDVLSTREAEYTARPSLEIIPWLEWLLLKGSRRLIENYIVGRNLTSNEFRVSRTKQAIMRSAIGGSFGIPPFAAGTSDDNFVTRALTNIESEVAIIIANEFSRNFP